MVKGLTASDNQEYTFLTDTHLTILEANKAFVSELDIILPMVVGKSFYDVMRIAERPKCEAAKISCLHHPDTIVTIDLTTIEPLGPEKSFRWDFCAVKSDKADEMNIRITGTDITLQKEPGNTSASLSIDSKTPFRTSYDQVFLDSLFEGIMFFDRQGEILIANNAAMEILGLTLQQMKGRTPLDPIWGSIYEDGTPFPGDAHPSIYTLRTGIACQQVIMGVRKPDSTIKWISINSQPVYFGQSKTPDAVTCSFIDITKQKEAGQQLQKSNELYEFARKATSDAIWDWDIIQDKIYLGEASKRLFGFPEMTIDMETQLAHIHDKDRDRYKDSLKKILNGTNDFWQTEYRFRGANGRYRYVLDKAYIVRDKNKKAVRMIGAMQDVTLQRKLEKKLLQETILRKKEVINTIISVQEKEKKEISDELHDNVSQILATCNLYLDVIIRENPGQRLLKECKGLLTESITELRAISHNLTPAAFKEKGLIQTVGEMTEKINRLGKITINLQASEVPMLEQSLLPEVKTAVYRIVQEQLKNILKHANASIVTINFDRIDAGFCMQIKDNGKGFDPPSVKKGLGLDNIQSRVALFNGHMSIRSAPGKGSSLRILFPNKGVFIDN